MTNEEILAQLLSEISDLKKEIVRLRNTVDSQNAMIEELRNYIRNNSNSNSDVIDDVSKEELSDVIDDVTNESVKINSDEPKSIVLSNQSKLNDNDFYGNDEDNYYKKLDKKVVEEYLNREVNEEKEDVSEEDRSMYIPGTNILKPRNRGYEETDEEYVKYLEEYYNKYFPKESKGLMTIDGNAPKSLAVLDDVKKPEEIEKLENAIKKNQLDEDDLDFAGIEGLDISKDYDGFVDIYSDSSKKAKSIFDEDDDKSEFIEFDSDEERESFEKGQSIDYKKDDNSKTKKIGKIRKAARKFKEVFKKHGKKIIAGILVAAATIGAATSMKSCSYVEKENLSADKNNSKSNSDENNNSVSSVDTADNFGVNINEVIDNINNKNHDEDSDDLKKNITVDNNADYNTSDKTYENDYFDIGQDVQFNGDSIYYTANDAENHTNSLTPLFPKEDKRKISVVEYVSPDGTQYKTVTTSDEQKVLEQEGWKPVSYNMNNTDRNTMYEGWADPEDITKVKNK